MPLDACTTISGFCLTQADSVCTWGKRGRRPEWVQAELWDEERGGTLGPDIPSETALGRDGRRVLLHFSPPFPHRLGLHSSPSPLPCPHPMHTLTHTFLDSYLPRGH